ncbi:MAG: hypothetical protein M3R24_02070 [Chloroflexota bacterium]|nr:hypothetical protein [Chloroflexota bacterium]
MDDSLRTFGFVLLSLLLIGVVLGAIMLAIVWRSLRRIKLPPNADFFTTVRAVPLGLVVGLDLLDLGLDMFAAPLVWIVLNRFKLQALRNVAAFEAIVPFTQPVPTLTIVWFAARLLNLGDPPRAHDSTILDTDENGPSEFAPRTGRR